MRQTDTIRRLRRDDLATTAVMRYQQDPELLDRDISKNPVLGMLKALADTSLKHGERPTSVAEWIALVLFAADNPAVLNLRETASKDADAVFVQAERWLELIDAQHARHQAQPADDPTRNDEKGKSEDGRRGTPREGR